MVEQDKSINPEQPFGFFPRTDTKGGQSLAEILKQSGEPEVNPKEENRNPVKV